MVDGWLIYNRDDYEKNRPFADLFVQEAGKYGLGLALKFADGLRTGISGGRAVVLQQGGASVPAFAINRTRDAVLGRCLEQGGCRVFNNSEVTRIANDKIESHLFAAALGLPQVDMVFCRNDPDSITRHGLGYPVVLKSPYGHGGSEVFLAHDEQELLARARQLGGGCAIVQRLCGLPGTDVRVYVLGGSVLQAVKRHSSSDFRANVSLGGAVEAYPLNAREQELVARVLGGLWLDYAGVDFILDEGGNLLFNEIEDVVGSRSLYLLGGFDVAGLYLHHIGQSMNGISL